MKSFRSRSFSGPYFPAFGLNTERCPYSVRMPENTDQKNFEYRHFSRSVGYVEAIYDVIKFICGSFSFRIVILDTSDGNDNILSATVTSNVCTSNGIGSNLPALVNMHFARLTVRGCRYVNCEI